MFWMFNSEYETHCKQIEKLMHFKIVKDNKQDNIN